MNLRTIRALLWAAVGIAGLGFGILLFLMTAGPQSQSPSPAEPLGGRFSLVDHNGAPVTERVLREQPTALFFGFTQCPDVCPTTLMDMTAWREALGDEAEDLRLVFVTVDPERDTPEVLKDYLGAFSPAIIGITGEPEKVAAMLQSYHVYSRKVPQEGGGYTMDHTASVFLLDGAGRFVGTISHGENRETALAKLERLVGAT
ncbi:MAG TPA: SCO family protein [Afifellaceae bacterium]|nr:SCO family protein [Afifellaceae bacterium]